MDTQEDYEWELSKENVQPIKKGRNIANLSAALQPHDSDQQAKMKEERQMFEEQIRSYSGEDPLEVWHAYIQWTEQNFPKGGKDSSMSTLLGRCVQLFTNEERYKNDPRYFDAWMKLAKFCVDVVEIFNYMHNNGIGVQLATFYEAWAWELENLGNTKRADAIYRMAIEKGAQPLDALRKRHSEFQARVARKVASGSLEASSDDSQMEADRTTLGELKGRGKKQAVPAVRTGAKSKVRGLNLGTGPSASNTGQGFQVFAEVENVPNPVPEATGEYRQVPTRKQANRENEGAVGPWNQTKLPQRGHSNVTMAEVSQHIKPGFAVHSDGEEQPMTTPRKVLPSMDSVLSEKKGKQRDPFQYIQDQASARSDGGSNQVPMYRKSEVYAGVCEFSFEELRAVTYFKKRKERAAREAEVASMKEQMAQQIQSLQDQMCLQQQQQQKYWMEQMQQQHQQQQHHWMQQMQQQQQQQQQHWNELMQQQMQHQRQDLLTMFEQERKEWQEKLRSAQTAQEREEVTRAQAAREEIINQTMTEMGFGEIPDTMTSAARQEVMETLAPRPVVPKQQSTPNEDLPSLPTQPSQPLPAARNVSLNMSSITPSNSHSFISGGPSNTRSGEPTPESFLKSFRSSSRGSMTAPSPTVNTREAMAAVMGMFNQTMEMGNALGWGGNSKGDDIEMDANFLGGRNPPMVIFEEGDEDAMAPRICTKLGGDAPPNKTPFAIHMDDEDVDMAPAVNKLQIHEDRENEPAARGGGKLPLKSALKIFEDKPQSAAPAMPFEDTAMECGVMFSEGPEMSMNIPDDMTFAPGFSSTRNFTKEAAHLASTPFNLKADIAAFPAPPVSTIKPVAEKSNTTAPGASSLSEDASSLSQSQRGALFTMSVAAEQTQNTTDIDPNSKKLSPIFETSENSTKSSGAASAMGTGSRLHMTTGETMHHHMSNMGASVHAPESCPDVSKMPPPPQKVLNFTASMHQSAVPVDSLLDDDPLEIPDVVDFPTIDSPPSVQDTINQTCHEIDVTNYFCDDKSLNLLSQSIMIDANNPFDEDRIKSFLEQLPQSLDTDPRYVSIPEPMPTYRKNITVQLGSKRFDLKEAIGQGAYAKVYKALQLVDDQQDDFDADVGAVVIKVQKPACPWEFYITSELAQRLKKFSAEVDITSSIMHIEEAYFFSDGSCLVNELHSNGTLLDLVNMVKQTNKRMPIPCFMLVAIELLHLVEQMQRCEIIHGDIKPDNFLFRAFPMGPDPAQFLRGSTQCVKLIDFGRSIDMQMYPPGTTFTTNVTTSGFQCIEMRTDRPWTYQTDLFGIVGTMHVLLWGEYMKVVADHNGVWKVNNSFRRLFGIGSLMENIFHDLLNIPSCEEIPDVSVYRRQLEDLFREPKNMRTYISEAEKINISLFMR